MQRAGFANRPVVVVNDLDDIIRTIALYSDNDSACWITINKGARLLCWQGYSNLQRH